MAVKSKKGSKGTPEFDDNSLKLSDLRAGDILLYRPQKPKPHARKISTATGSPYIHASIYLGNGYIAESRVIGGVQKNPVSSALSGAAYLGVLRTQMGFGRARTKLLSEFIDEAIKSGGRYDLKGALAWPHKNKKHLASQLEIIREQYGKFKTNQQLAKTAFICSALVVACFTAVKIIDEMAQVAYPPAAFAPGTLPTDPTFGWVLGYVIPKGQAVPDDDPLKTATQWEDMPDMRWW